MLIILATRNKSNRNIEFKLLEYYPKPGNRIFQSLKKDTDAIFLNFTDKKEKDIFRHFENKHKKLKELKFEIMNGYELIPAIPFLEKSAAIDIPLESFVTLHFNAQTFLSQRSPSSLFMEIGVPETFVKWDYPTVNWTLLKSLLKKGDNNDK